MEATWVALHDPTFIIVNLFVCFGMLCAFATFVFMMPIVANTILGVWSTVMQEQIIARFRGKRSGVDLPEDHPASLTG